MRLRHLALALAACWPAMARAQQADTSYAQVTYVVGISVYIDAGTSAGLAANDTLELVRAQRSFGRLRVLFVSSRRAQCQVVTASAAPVEGDSVRVVHSARAARGGELSDTAAVVAPAMSAPVEPARSPAQTLRGRLGLRYFTMKQRDSSSASWTQPGSDVRLEGPLPSMPDVAVALDARGRRTTSVTINGVVAQPQTSTSVYQASLAWQTGGTRVRVGRQYSELMADVSLFDGALVQHDGDRFGAGAFVGSQPDAVTMGFSTRVREYGAYVDAHQRDPLAPTRWNAATGAIGSYDAGQLDREFVFASGSWTSALLSLYATQEVDYNRGWKRTFGGSLFSPTSTLVTLSARVIDHLSIEGGYDTRRSVRLYRDYVTPEIAFDDAFRSGVWGGVIARSGASSLGLDYRRSSGGTAGSADILSASASAGMSAGIPLRVRERSSRFTTPIATGWLHSATLSGDVTSGLELELSGGVRLDHNRPTSADTTGARSTAQWYELGADWSVARSWFVLLSLTRNLGGWDSSDQVYAALTYRF